MLEQRGVSQGKISGVGSPVTMYRFQNPADQKVPHTLGLSKEGCQPPVLHRRMIAHLLFEGLDLILLHVS